MKTTNRAITLLIALALIITLPSNALAVMVNGRYVAGDGLYIMDYETGEELYSYNKDVAYVPASITKLMSMYLVYESIENGDITLDTVVPISANVRRLSNDSSFWNTVPLNYNETYYVSELIDLILVYSASASVVALAELISGDEDTFVARMNEKAKEWGLNARFVGSSGIQDNYISPHSVALLSRKIMMDYPQVLDHTKKSSTYFHGRTYSGTNNLLSSQYYEGADGLKSGTTDNAGFCFVGTAVRNGVRLITVVMRSSSKTQRYTDSHVLLDYGFSIRDEVIKRRMQIAPFTDVYKTDWFADDVMSIVDTGIMTGTSYTTFSPHDNITRGMAAQMLYRIAGEPQTAYEEIYSDVPQNIWCADSVSWAHAGGIIEGEPGDAFGVNDVITRQEFVTMLYKYADHSGKDVSAQTNIDGYEDASLVSDWAAEPISWAIATGLITGTSDTTLAPLGLTSRAECAVLMLRYLNLA